jgi:cobalt/nickel transport system permease protein
MGQALAFRPFLGSDYLANMYDNMHNLRLWDDLARRPNAINSLHPLAKLLTTGVYLIVVVSFDRYEISSLLPLIFYPVFICAWAELPMKEVLKRIAWAMPFVIGIGIFNPLFDKQIIEFMGITISRGWLTFLSIVIKCVLTVAAGVLLMATTGMERLGMALRMIRVPRVFVLQLLLTYRYISLLMGELARMLRAYALRSPEQKGIKAGAWGPFAGSLLLRSFDRAQRVYAAMCLRGFAGEYHTGAMAGWSIRDTGFLAGWSAFFLMARCYDLPLLLGSLLTGVLPI